MLELVDRAPAGGRHRPRARHPRDRDPRDRPASSSRPPRRSKVLGWAPPLHGGGGARATVDWYRTQLDLTGERRSHRRSPAPAATSAAGWSRTLGRPGGTSRPRAQAASAWLGTATSRASTCSTARRRSRRGARGRRRPSCTSPATTRSSPARIPTGPWPRPLLASRHVDRGGARPPACAAWSTCPPSTCTARRWRRARCSTRTSPPEPRSPTPSPAWPSSTCRGRPARRDRWCCASRNAVGAPARPRRRPLDARRRRPLPAGRRPPARCGCARPGMQWRDFVGAGRRRRRDHRRAPTPRRAAGTYNLGSGSATTVRGSGRARPGPVRGGHRPRPPLGPPSPTGPIPAPVPRRRRPPRRLRRLPRPRRSATRSTRSSTSASRTRGLCSLP